MVFECSKSSNEMSSLPFPTRLRWKILVELIFIEVRCQFSKGGTWIFVPIDCPFQRLIWSSPLLNTIQGWGRKGKICPRPSNMFCLLIEIYLSVVEAILKYHYWSVLKVILNKSPKCYFLQLVFNLCGENGKISSKNYLKSYKTRRGS